MLISIILLLCAGLAAGISAIICRSALTVREYELTLDGITQPFTAVCITDLHSREFGRDNAGLLERVRAQRPDVIFTLGDLISRDASEEKVERMCRLYGALRQIAPVYASFGNHEQDYMRRTGTALGPLIRDAGAIGLDEECVIAEIAGSRICLGGTLGHLWPAGRSREVYLGSPEFRLMEQMLASGLPAVVLAHRPDTIIFEEAYEHWNIDLFLSGHTHGGLIRLPFIGGLYAPRQGFFPRFDRGCFQIGKTRLLISGGLAGYGAFPRIFNRPELCVIRIIPPNAKAE